MCSYNKTLTTGNSLFSLMMIGLCLLSTAAPAIANEASAEEIARLNEEVAVLSAKLAEADMQAKLAAKQQEIKKINEIPMTTEILPVVRSIEGADGRLIATLITSTGAHQSVVKGDKVGKWIVAQIKINQVTLRRGKRYTQLAFGNVPPMVQPTTTASIGIPLSAPILVPPPR